MSACIDALWIWEGYSYTMHGTDGVVDINLSIDGQIRHRGRGVSNEKPGLGLAVLMYI